MIPVLVSYLPGLLLTLLLEAAVIVALARGTGRRAAVSACLALNLFTHPFATLLAWRWSVDVIALEALVFCCEWLGYLQLLSVRWTRALAFALAANMVSWAAGLGLWMWRLAA